MNNKYKINQFSYKGYIFNIHFESDPNQTWAIATLHPKSITCFMPIFEVVGDGLAEAKWLATRHINKNAPSISRRGHLQN